MSISIPKEIADDEVLAHYLFHKNFNGKIVKEEKLISKNIFLPNKGGVSMQRANYCDENQCKKRACAIIGKVYAGFIIFRKSSFEDVKLDYIKNDRKEFEAEIVSTPLDEHFNYLPEDTEVTTDSPGNPAHSDLKYINPAVREEESPNTAIRSFSRKLSKICKLVIDNEATKEAYQGPRFDEVV